MIHFISRSGNYAIKITYIFFETFKNETNSNEKKTLHISEKAKKKEKYEKF